MPYVDFVDINPPMIYYLCAATVALAHFLGIAVPKVFQLCVLALVFYSTAALYRLLSQSNTSLPESSRCRERAPILVAATWLSFSLGIFLAMGFGQREHLFMLAYVPWLYARVARHEGRPVWAGWLLGFVAGPFMLLKPHFCVAVAAVELWLLARNRRFQALWAPEILTAGLWAVAYLIHFNFLPSAMRDGYFHRWVPFVVAHYRTHNPPLYLPLITLIASLLSMFTILAGWGLLAGKRVPPGARGYVQTLSIGVLAGIGLLVTQGKYWDYHFYPAIGFGLLLAATVKAGVFDSVTLAKGAPGALSAFVLVLIPIALPFGTWTLGAPHRSAMSNELNGWRAYLNGLIRPGDTMAIISTSVTPAYPLFVYVPFGPGTRFLTAFPIPMFYDGVSAPSEGPFPYRTAENWTPEERRYLTELGEDLAARNCALVAIQATPVCQACPPGFRVDEYLERAGWSSRYLSHYKFQGRFRDFLIYLNQN